MQKNYYKRPAGIMVFTEHHILKLCVLFMISLLVSCSERQPEMKALILTGQNNHNWQDSHIILKTILEKTGIFNVEISISPQNGEDMLAFFVDFKPFDVVVLDYNGDHWPETTRNNFVEYVQNGGGVVVYHSASNSFPSWEEYNEIIGLGGWGDRNEEAGPYVYVLYGEVVRDYDTPGRGGSHGPRHEFLIEAHKPDHPILNGLPEKWLQTEDELYGELRGTANNLEVLAYAWSDKENRGTGRNEPILMTIRYGDGRVFHTTLGHTGNDFFTAIESAGFITTFQRGAEWAATGSVTQRVPEVFPSETQSLRLPIYEGENSSR